MLPVLPHRVCQYYHCLVASFGIYVFGVDLKAMDLGTKPAGLSCRSSFARPSLAKGCNHWIVKKININVQGQNMHRKLFFF